MKKKSQDLQGHAPKGHTFVPTEQGSARFVALDGEGSTYKYETCPTVLGQGFSGPPWSIEPSMHFLCDEVGIDYQQFIAGLAKNVNEMEMARELGVDKKTIEGLKELFYRNEAINGNYGQD